MWQSQNSNRRLLDRPAAGFVRCIVSISRLSAALLLATALISRAQQALTDNQLVFRASTTLVQIDVVVTDKKGNPVPGLEGSDFEIYQDGHPQKIKAFSYVSVPRTLRPGNAASVSKGAPSQRLLRRGEVHRTLAFVVDDLGLSFESAYYVRNALTRFVNQEMDPHDLVAILRTRSGAGVLQQFTADRQLLRAAVERVRYRPVSLVAAPTQHIAARDVTKLPGPDENKPERIGGPGSQMVVAGTLGAMAHAIRALKEMPGRKSVILISDGLRLLPEARDSFGRLLELANRASVVIYCIDPRGLFDTGWTAADEVGIRSPAVKIGLRQITESTEGLRYLAAGTGGLFLNPNRVIDAVQRVVQDQSGYYLLGYRPDDLSFTTAPGGRRRFHNIKVTVRQRGLSARTRTGFYGVTDEQAAAEDLRSGARLLAALMSPFASGDIHLRATPIFAVDPKRGPYIRCLLHIEASDLTFVAESDGWRAADVEVVVATFGESGVPIDQTWTTYHIRDRGDSLERGLSAGIDYTVNHIVRKRGPYQLRAAVRDTSSGRIGSASEFVQVPKVDEFALSGILLGAAAGAARRLAPGEKVPCHFQIFNPRKKASGAQEISVRFALYREGTLAFAWPPATVAVRESAGRLPLHYGAVLEFPRGLEPGSYVLQVLVQDNPPKPRAAIQSLDVEIVPRS